MARLDMQVGVHYHVECFSPTVIQALTGMDIEVKCPLTGKLEWELHCLPGDVVDVPMEMYQKYVTPLPHVILEDSELKWEEEFDNLVVTEGRNALLNTVLDNAAPSAGLSWFVGLKDTGAVVAGDTMAAQTNWVEISPYSNATRPAFTASTSVSGSTDNSAAKAAFTINATDEVFGAFLVNENTVDGALGTLYGAGDFGAQRSVQSGDTLNVTATATITSS